MKNGLEGKKNVKLGGEVPYTDRGPLLNNSDISAVAPNYQHASSQRIGVVLPWTEGFSVLVCYYYTLDECSKFATCHFRK